MSQWTRYSSHRELARLIAKKKNAATAPKGGHDVPVVSGVVPISAAASDVVAFTAAGAFAEFVKPSCHCDNDDRSS